MERPQLIGRDAGPQSPAIVDRCHECRGALVQAGEEVACTNCGAVARKENLPLEAAATVRRASPDRRLGSYMGTKSDEGSIADFNGNSTVGYAKRVSDHMGENAAAWNCSAMIERVAEKLSLPAFVRHNAVLLSEKMLADWKKDGEQGKKRRATVPAISAYALLAACRDARIDHVSAKSVMKAHTDLGHRVTKSKLLRLGTESRVPLRPADPAALLQTVVSCLESNKAVAERLEKKGVERLQYFRRLLQASQTITGEVRGLKGNSPRTVAACSVYMASREIGHRAITQREVAETLGIAEYTVREFSCWARGELAKPRPLKAGGP